MTKFEDESGVYSREFCMKVAQKISALADLPLECQRHGDVMSNLKRRMTKMRDNATAVSGFGANAPSRIGQAKMQRRLTNTRRFQGRATQNKE